MAKVDQGPRRMGLAKSVVLECEACGKRFLSTGETKCIMCEADKVLDKMDDIMEGKEECQYCGRQFPSTVAVRVHESKCLVEEKK